MYIHVYVEEQVAKVYDGGPTLKQHLLNVLLLL